MARFFRLRPKSRAQAARSRRPKLTRERSSKYYLRRRDQEPSKGKAVLWRKDRAATPEQKAAAARILKRERIERQRNALWTVEDEQVQQTPTYNLFFQDGTRQDVCQTRATRAGVLFAKGIAGKKGKSPGKGGTYKRTETSSIQCERSI